MKEPLRIERMYAFVAVDPVDNTEGVVSFQGSFGSMPMVGADMEMVRMLRPMAQQIAEEMEIDVTLCLFTTREEVEVLGARHT